MTKRLSLLIFLTTALLSLNPAAAGEVIVQDFVKGSLNDIKEERKDQPFLLVFWSKDCGYCFKEMNMLAKLQPKHPELDIVLVSTDAGLEDEMVKHFFDQTGLEADEIWVFSSDSPKLFSYVDRDWQGELPNTVFHNSKHEYQSILGEVKYKQIKNWLKYIKNEKS